MTQIRRSAHIGVDPCEEDRISLLRALDTAPAVEDSVGLGRAAAVDRLVGGGRGGGRGWRVLPGAPLRAATGFPLPVARGDRRAYRTHRDRYRGDRHALAHVAVATPVHVSLAAWSNW